jgi:glycosyltransferase involved in cell wall biosynthesis
LTYPGFDKETLNSHEWIASETKLYQQASGIFTMSNHVKNSLFNQYHIPLDKIKCVYAGSNISYSDISYPLDRYAQKNILFVGVNWERKGGPELFEAFKLVYEKHLDANLHIVGCNPEIQHPNVKIWGKLPLDEVKKHYQSASVFCMPSRREPFGIVYLEAMAYKLPIIALKIGALPDFVEDAKNGFLLNYKDIHGLASKIIFLLDNPEISLEMGEYAYQKMEKQYQWEISLASIREFIENQGVIEKEN